MKTRVKILLLGISGLVTVSFLTCLPYLTLHFWARPLTFATPQTLTPTFTAVVLGSKVNEDGSPASALKGRLDDAALLYHSQKVQKIIVSGDNRFIEYNEPAEMKKYLISQGVPDDAIMPDYAGRRTYDTCWRLKHIFGQSSAIIVTNTFHLPRTLFLCAQQGIAVQGFSSDSTNFSLAKTSSLELREVLSSVKAVIDAYIWHPRVVGGEPIQLSTVPTPVSTETPGQKPANP